MQTILIITSSYDYTIDYVIDTYKELAYFKRINVDRLKNYKISFQEGGKGWKITTKLWNIHEKDIHSIYYRKPMLPDLGEYEPEYTAMISKDIISIFNGLADSFKGKVLTRPYILRQTENKVYQVQTAHYAGFTMPDTLITTDKNEATTFLERYNRCIIKPLTTGKILNDGRYEVYQTNEIKEIRDEISLTPICVQKYQIKSYEVRVTAINGYFYGVRIDSYNKVDWRKDESFNKYTTIDIPEDTQLKCRKLMESMKLKFGAFDFIVSEEEWIFLEVNPNGQWLWLEEELGLDISKRILDYLIQ